MNKAYFQNFFTPVIIVFILINAICFTCVKWLDAKGIDHTTVLIGNVILFFLTLITSSIHIKALKNNNPYAFVRAVTMASFLKLIIIAVSVIIYFKVAATKSLYAVAVVMFFYIVYTIFEVRGAMNLNRKRNAKN